MSFIRPREPGPRERLPVPPPPPNDPRWHERDRFGLAIVPPTLLAESGNERRARIATVERLATDMFETAVTHLGRLEARRLFAEVAKAPWKKGKQPNRSRNDELLDMYDNAVREAPDRIRSIPRLLAKEMNPKNPRSAPATEKQIRRLVKDRSRRQKAMEEAYRRFPRTLLGSSDRDI
jgi:transketolase